jgi:glycosyltransferase involved in cell wall biosynthesis
LITFLVYSPYPRYSGGRENWLHNVGRALSHRGQAVSVVSLASNRRVFYAPVAGVEFVSLPSVRYFDRAFFWINRIGLGLPRILDTLVLYPLTAAWYLARRKPKVLVCMNSIPEGMAAALARRPYFVSVRGDVPAEMAHGFKLYERLLRRLERRVLRRALRVLANGPDTQDRLARDGIVSTLVPNGVDLARFRSPQASSASAQAMMAAAAGRPVIAVVGTLRPIKGTDLAIECAVELKRSAVPFLMAMVGKGDVEHYRGFAQSKDVDDAVWFAGETSDVPAILRHTDVFLGLSGGSGLSMAVLEAMAAGVAVVALDSPVYTQLIQDGVNGRLASTSAELARACVVLLNDPELGRRLGAEGSLTADRYDWRLVADRLFSVLAQ